MKKIFLFCTLLWSFTSYGENSVTGQWKTIDDETGKPRSVVEIAEVDGQLKGKILQLFREPNEEQNPVCKDCSGEKKDKPVIGMEILWNLKKDSDLKWSGGDILDPKNGKTYSCKIELIDGGQKLKVRGFLGLSLLGRTQIWERFKE